MVSDDTFFLLCCGAICFSLMGIGAVCGYAWGMHLERLKNHGVSRETTVLSKI